MVIRKEIPKRFIKIIKLTTGKNTIKTSRKTQTPGNSHQSRAQQQTQQFSKNRIRHYASTDKQRSQ